MDGWGGCRGMFLTSILEMVDAMLLLRHPSSRKIGSSHDDRDANSNSLSPSGKRPDIIFNKLRTTSRARKSTPGKARTRAST